MDLLIDSLFTKKQMAVYDNLYISPYPSYGLFTRIISFFLYCFITFDRLCAGYDATEAGTGHSSEACEGHNQAGYDCREAGCKGYDADQVFVEVAPWTFEARAVEIDFQQGDRITVKSGVQIGDRVVVRGGVLLND